jgi:putative hydrolase
VIDLHTHTFFSDGELIPSELVRRLEVMGYRAVSITDHADSSNLDFIVPRIAQVSEELNRAQSVKVVPGVELTHVPPSLIGSMVTMARELGAALVVVHGESPVEPVAEGTNQAALEAGADILAHPGLISSEQAALAAEKGVLLEVSGRSGHCFANGHVARVATETGARLVINSDAHGPYDLMTESFAARVVEGAGLPKGSLQELLSNALTLLGKIGYPL